MVNHTKYYRSKEDGKIYKVWYGEDLNVDKIMLLNCFNSEEVLVSLNTLNNEFVEYDITI